MLRFVLEQQSGHHVDEAETPETAEALVSESQYDLVLMDVVMPGLDGFELCKRVRRTHNVPIMIVSARGDVPSRVRGLQLGADDYLPKPFDPGELAARVEAMLRRAARSARVDGEGRLRIGDLTLHLGDHRVEIRSGRGGARMVPLTQTEFKLLLLLARTPGEAVSRGAIEQGLWGGASGEAGSGYSTVNAYVAELRGRLEADPRHPRHLVTVRGVGYKLVP